MENKYRYIWGKVSDVAVELNKGNCNKTYIPIGPPTVYYNYKLTEPYIIQLVEEN